MTSWQYGLDCTPYIQAKSDSFPYTDIEGNFYSGSTIEIASFAIYVKTIPYC